MTQQTVEGTPDRGPRCHLCGGAVDAAGPPPAALRDRAHVLLCHDCLPPLPLGSERARDLGVRFGRFAWAELNWQDEILSVARSLTLSSPRPAPRLRAWLVQEGTTFVDIDYRPEPRAGARAADYERLFAVFDCFARFGDGPWICLAPPLPGAATKGV